MFAPHEVVTDTDRDRYVVNRIMDFYRRQRPDLADYFLALWRYENRSGLGLKGATLESIAAKERLSLPYLERLQPLLRDRTGAFGPVAGLQQRWDAMRAAPTRLDEEAARTAARSLRDYVVGSRKNPGWTFEVPRARPLHVASQMTAMHVNRQEVAHLGGGAIPAVLIPADAADPSAKGYDADLVVPADPVTRAAAVASLQKFCDLIPDAFLVTERTSPWLAKNQTGRLLSAGFHSANGYFRDYRPLYDLISDDLPPRRSTSCGASSISSATPRPVSSLASSGSSAPTRTSCCRLSSMTSAPRTRISRAATSSAQLRRLYDAKLAASTASAETRRHGARLGLRRARCGHSLDGTGADRGAAVPPASTS